MQLSKSQTEAASHFNGPCLVLAVPGAGKTTVLLKRLENLIASGVSPKNIASITFSRLQARDMEKRFFDKFPNARDMTFSTIHAFCYRITLSYARKNGENINLIETSDNWNKYKLISKIFYEIKKRSISEDELESFFRIDGYLKNSLLTYEQFLKNGGSSFSSFKQISSFYEKFKTERNLIDFDDMLLRSLQILEKDQDILEAIRRRFIYLQVDEAQDTSPIQLKIIEKIAAPKNNLFMVADDDQTIYGFRGADPSYLLQFKKLYPNAKILAMEDNYRSCKNIVNLSSLFIKANEDRYSKSPSAMREDNEKIRLFNLSSLEEELFLLKNEIPKDLEKGNCAILFRNNLSMIALADLFSRMEIPFKAHGNYRRFFDHAIFKDIVDILHFSIDPSDLDCFKRIYYKLNSYIKKSFIHALEYTNPLESVLDRISELEDCNNSFYQEKIGYLQYEFDRIRNLSARKAIYEIDNFLGYGAYLKEREKITNTSANSSSRIMEIIKVISQSSKSIPDFIQYLRTFKNIFEEKSQTCQDLQISTIHGSKGLEYDTVWLLDLVQGEFPSNIALNLEKEGLNSMLEEERRLFYVGMTRARLRLRLVGIDNVNGRHYGHSQFIDEIKLSNEK